MHIFLETERLILRRFTADDVEYALTSEEWAGQQCGDDGSSLSA